ncbi:OpgC domain-containing protein, partial [Bradyrhizobium sp.]
VRLLHFLSLALVVSRLTPPQWNGPARPLMTAIIRCGENSLSIYCIGVLLAFIGQVVLTDVSSGFAMQLLISIAGIAVMVIAATLLTWETQLDRRGPRLF